MLVNLNGLAGNNNQSFYNFWIKHKIYNKSHSLNLYLVSYR